MTDPLLARSAAEPVAALSKTRRKARMHALQALGARLVDLDPARLAELELPERLVEAIADARRITGHEARRRQVQFIGRLMREVEPEPIEARFAAWAQGPAAEQALHRSAERWRERLLAQPDAVDQWMAERPACDRPRLRSLLARVRAEQAAQQPPRAYRELYRLLRDTLAVSAASVGGSPPSGAGHPSDLVSPSPADGHSSGRGTAHA